MSSRRVTARAPRRALEPIEKIGQRTGPLGLVRTLKFSLRGRERLGREARKAHEVDAVAGVDGVFVRTGEPFGDEPHDRARFVERPGSADAMRRMAPSTR